jgi:regulator of vacuolar morphogenesis
MTASSWLSENSDVNGVLRTARAALLKRDALARTGDVASRTAGGEARKALRDAGPRIDTLEQALEMPALQALGDGERRRRSDLVQALRSEHANLLRTAEAGVRRATPPSSGASTPMPGGLNSAGSSGMQQLAPGRVFGRRSPPKETAETRPLDDRGLVQLQYARMSNQDEQLGALSSILRKQRAMGQEIHSELAVQNEMLDQLDTDVSRVGTKMARAKRQMNRLG